jgi:hypothetical protein
MAATRNDSPLGSAVPARPGEALELDTSVAGEEDPGASFDLPVGAEGRSDPPSDRTPKAPTGARQAMAPGDQAAPARPAPARTCAPSAAAPDVSVPRVAPTAKAPAW